MGIRVCFLLENVYLIIDLLCTLIPSLGTDRQRDIECQVGTSLTTPTQIW